MAFPAASFHPSASSPRRARGALLGTNSQFGAQHFQPRKKKKKRRELGWGGRNQPDLRGWNLFWCGEARRRQERSLHPARDLFRGLTSSFRNEQPSTGSRTNVTQPSRALQPRSPAALKVQGLVEDGFFLPEIAYIGKSFSSATVCCLTKALHMLEPQSHGAAVIAGLFYPATSFNEIYRNLISLRPLSFCQIG